MKTTKILFSLAIAGLFVLAACSKYEEGPKLSLRSKKARLAGDWKLVESSLNGTVQQITGYTVNLSIKKDGNYTYAYSSAAGTISTNGTWEFTDDKTGLISKPSTGGSDTVTITKLKNKELWFKEVSGVNTQITKYEQ